VASEQDLARQEHSEDSGAQDDESLDSILDSIDQEYDQDTKPPKQQQDKDDPRVRQLEATVTELTERQLRNDIDHAVSTIAENLTVKPSNRVISGLLNEMAKEDPRIVRAFENRQNDPTTWNRLLKGVAKDIDKEFQSDVDTDVSENREALSRAVQGKSTAKNDEDDEAKRFNRFATQATDHEIAEFKRTGRIPESFK